MDGELWTTDATGRRRRWPIAVAAVLGAVVVLVGVAWLAFDRALGGTPVDDPTLERDPAVAAAALADLRRGVDAPGWELEVEQVRGELRTNGGLMGGSPERPASATATWRRRSADPAQVMELARRVDAELAGAGWRARRVDLLGPADTCTGLGWADPSGVGDAWLRLPAVGERTTGPAPTGVDVALTVTVRDAGARPRQGPAVPGTSPEVLACAESWVRSGGS